MIAAPYPERDCESVGEYNARHVGKAWSIVAMTWQGSAYCADCAGGWPTYEHDLWEGPAPVFASDDCEGMVCDECLSAVGPRVWWQGVRL